MSVTIKTPGEIELMREAGRILALVHEELGKIIEPGISTYEIDKEGERLIRSFSCIPSFLNYNGYPASICVSVNEEVVHGIPSRKRILKEGDIVSVVLNDDGTAASITVQSMGGDNMGAAWVLPATSPRA